MPSWVFIKVKDSRNDLKRFFFLIFVKKKCFRKSQITLVLTSKRGIFIVSDVMELLLEYAVRGVNIFASVLANETSYLHY